MIIFYKLLPWIWTIRIINFYTNFSFIYLKNKNVLKNYRSTNNILIF